jgi:hypothetical protein
MKQKNQPAFPPQVMQDTLGRIIAPIPGMTKIEFLGSLLLPHMLQMKEKYDGIIWEGKLVNPFDAALLYANLFFEKCKTFEDETDKAEIIDAI